MAYSRWDLTFDSYKFWNISWSINVKVLKIIPMFLLSEFMFELIWSLNVVFFFLLFFFFFFFCFCLSTMNLNLFSCSVISLRISYRYCGYQYVGDDI